MADMNNRIHSLGSGNHHHHQVSNHTTPLFYVPPPSHPFYMYQWNMNMNPYGHHVSGLPHASHYMAPYPYMSGYPRYVMPQAPIYPVDYRRIFNPHLSSSPADDVHLRQHYSHITRKTASSEVQTDQDSLSKLIGRLDALKTSEAAENEDKEPVISDTKILPLVMMTQSSSDIGENETELKPFVQRRLPMAQPDGHVSHQPPPLPCIQPIPNDSTAQEASTTGSILSSLGETPQASKSGAHLCDETQYDTQSPVSGIDIFPLDSSSVNGEEEDVEYSLEAFCPVSKNMEDFEKSAALCPNISLAEKHRCGINNPNLDLNRSSTEDEMLDAARCLRQELQQNLSCPLDSSSSTFHSYCPHPKTQADMEPQSILSPSIDEWSSGYNFFSTQLYNNADDDLIVKGSDLSIEPVYVGGGKMATNQDAHKDFGKENCIQLVDELASEWSTVSLQTCACCGTSLGSNDERRVFRADRGGRVEYEYLERFDEAEQVEVEYREEEAAAEMFEGPEALGRCAMPGRLHHYYYSSTRPHAYCPPLQLYPSRRSGKICDCEEHEGMEEMLTYDEQQDQDPHYRPAASVTSKNNKFKGKGRRNPPARTWKGSTKRRSTR